MNVFERATLNEHRLRESLMYQDARYLEEVCGKNLCTFAKNERSEFIYVNNTFAQLAGFDSPHELLQKTDYHCTWKEHAKKYQDDDYDVLNSVDSKIITDFITTKISAKDTVELTVYTQKKRYELAGKRCVLGYFKKPIIYQQKLTATQWLVFICKVMGYSDRAIADCMRRSVPTINDIVERIKNKCDVKTSAELIRYGFANQWFKLDDGLMGELKAMLRHHGFSQSKLDMAKNIMMNLRGKTD